jgi:hypothetical protein
VPKRRHDQNEPTFEQAPDATGRTRLDRRLTPEEAAAQDEANRRAYLAARARRFFSPSPEESEA